MNKKKSRGEKRNRSIIKEHLESANVALIASIIIWLFIYSLAFFKLQFHKFSIWIQTIISPILYVSLVIIRPPIPYGFGGYYRWLEPGELREVERRILTFIFSRDGKREAVKGTILVYGILAVYKFIGSFLKTAVEERNLIEDTIPFFFFFSFFEGILCYVFSLKKVLSHIYKNWEIIEMTVEPWPIDKPYWTPIFKRKKLLTLEDYEKRLKKLSEEVEFVKEFLETHPFENLSLFLSDNRFSPENLKKISELENPTDYFEFLENLSYEDEKFQKFSIGNLINGFHSRLEEDPESYYESYERLFMKAEGDLLKVMGEESFNDFVLENLEFFLERMEKDPNWREKAEKLFSFMSRYELKEIKEGLPDNSFGREIGEYIDKFLDRKTKRRRKR